MTPPKVLFVTTVDTTLVSFLLPYVRDLRQRGFRVEAATCLTRHGSSLARELDALHDLPFTRSPLKLNNLRALRALAALLREEHYHLVHCHTPTASFLARLAPRPARTRMLYTAHGFHFHPQGTHLANWTYAILERLAAQRSDAVIVINEEDARAAVDHRIVARERLCRMHGIGVDTNHFAATADGDARCVTMIAELIPRKRPADFLRLAALLAPGLPDVEFQVLGDGPLRPRLERMAARLGLAGRLRFLGYQEDVRPALERSALLVSCSTQEGLPRAVLEAMAMHVPVLATRIRGTHELLRDGCGFMVPVGNVPVLARYARWILAHPEAARSAAHRARERVVTRYGLERTLEEHEGIVARLLSQWWRPPARPRTPVEHRVPATTLTSRQPADLANQASPP
ncbi:MAG: glycosyltransferase [Deltaproteobacteria bacterium]|nr:glycosyltransferase [Deltaproteobacteria bacterium]